MDESLRRLLRNRNITAQECVFPLKRSGITNLWDVAYALIENGKVRGYDHAFQVFVDVGLMSLTHARDEIAEDLYGNYQYPDNVNVLDTDGWVCIRDTFEQAVYVVYQEDIDALFANAPEGAIIDDPDSELTYFYVEFEPGSVIVKDFGVHDVRGVD